ncbi:hypothetical protein CR205_00310 [Alteribacter lacisalsi]|uniref:Fibronectin type-III domain-containing protein n=1 Tax=Alteribacter lacisalsi TaxID=2045244 RepID=A0A2W0H8M0_9BACI|nr:cell wall-binding repeat-containing protein [Alteribacter lacisalsi]PYZ97086.1 hypothetical protein CR205_00310 [Alteribacter lacisalsi]
MRRENQRKFRVQFSIVMAMMLVFTPFASLSANAQGDAESDTFTTFKDENLQTAEEKVDSAVMDLFEEEEYVSVLIEMNEQVDTNAVVQNLDLNTATSDYQEKQSKRYAVFDALHSTAERTQAPLLNSLEQAQNDGLVQDFESFYIMNYVHAEVSQEYLEELKHRPEVASIRENGWIEIDLPEQEDLPEVQNDDNVEWNIDQVQAVDAWSFGFEGAGITVGVIDTGVQWDHDALIENFRGYNPEDPDNPDAYGNWLDRTGNAELPEDIIDHGTHVTGTVLGQDAAQENIIGVAPEAQWIAARAFTAFGGSEADLLASGEYMLAPEDNPDLAPDIVQNSWGGQPGVDDWYQPIVQAWRDAGQLPVFSAGNSGPGAETVTPPANYPESYAVAATDIDNEVASFSSRGPSNMDGDDQKPNISAPGVNIRSSVPGNGYEGGFNGTSMAAPHIAGTAAILLSIDAGLSPDDIEDILDETATPLTDDQYTEVPNDGYGVGLLNVYDAVAMVSDGVGTIEGHVLQEGSDDEAPEIEHSPITETYAGLDVPVTAHITDNVAVTEAMIRVSHEDHDYDVNIPMELVDGDHTDGEYRGYIPWNFVQEPGFEYRIIAHDFGNNASSTDDFWVDVEFGVEPDEYTEDFENYPNGWTLEGDWEWGSPEAGPEPVIGENLVGTNLEGNYSDNQASLAMLPPLDLRDSDEASVRLNHWYDIEDGFDLGAVAVSNDYGENWDLVDIFTGQDQEWRNLFVDLDSYVGSEDPVLVAFEFITDVDTNYLGWYLDNVNLIGEDDEAPSVPENLSAEQSAVGVSLSWDASPEVDTAGYNVYRSESADGEFEHIGDTSATAFNDTDTEGGTEYFYYVTAFDFSGNESDGSNVASAEAPHVVVAYYSDFNEDEGGFTTDGENNSWEWGEPTSGPGEAYVGDNLWATGLGGDYNNSEDSYIESPEIELGDELNSATLHFAHWKDIEDGWDYAYLQVSNDGGDSWTDYAEYTGNLEEWQEGEFALDQYIGDTVQIRFALDTDSIITDAGWYIDDVMVLATADEVDYTPETAPIERTTVDTDRERSEADAFSFNLQKDLSEYNAEKVYANQIVDEESGLPLDATVTALESGRTVNTNPMDGSYTMSHPPTDEGETLTLQADAYGFYPETAEVSVEADETTYQDFLLDPMATGVIDGTVVDERTGEAIEGATARVLEDYNLDTDVTGADGDFTIEDVIYGEYTLRVTADDYHPAEVHVEVEGDEVTHVTVEMRPFIGFDDEIAYDNGEAENALVLNDAGNGMGVRFTPEGSTEVRGATMYIWGEDFPEPGGDHTQVAVYETDSNGNPTDMAVGPIDVEVERGGWNYVDFGDESFVTENDFLITTIQTEIGELSPAVGTDEEQPNAERSYVYLGGSFDQESDFGNFMIRANVAYSLDAPVIETPEDGTFTSEDSIEVIGQVDTESEVTIYNNEDTAAVVETDEDGNFAADVSLEEGHNSIYAEATVEDGTSDPSEPVTVIKDTVDPVIDLETPYDGMETSDEVITVSGTITDENFSHATVNGEEVEVSEDGSFSTREILEEGENTITIEATDLAGNTAVKEVTVYVDLTAPSIEDVQPDSDVTVEPGEDVTVSFNSDTEGGEASFVVTVPSAGDTNNDHRVTMEETEPGHYSGTWTAPDASFEDGVVEITLEDTVGNTSTAYAEGTVTVGEAADPVVDRLFGDTRYETAVEISQAWDASDVVVLTNNAAYADALAGVPLAHHYDAPMLLTNGSALTDVTADELDRLDADRVIVLGGANVIEDSVVADLESHGLHVDRIAGDNRYDTSYEIASYLNTQFDVDSAVVANGQDFPDALSVASYAAQHGMPVLLTGSDSLSAPAAQALTSLDVEDALVVGGYTVIDEDVQNQVEALGVNSQRLGGENRFETNIAVTEHFAPETDHMYVATGLNFADALTGAALAAQNDSGILLTGSSVHAPVADYISGSDLNHLTIFGGPSAVSSEIESDLYQLLQ